MTNHDKAHYAIAATLFGLLIWHVGLTASSSRLRSAEVKVTAAKIDRVVAGASRKTVKGAWPSLGQAKTIAIGEALGLPARTVALFCSSIECSDLREDLDDALQIAGWTGVFEGQAMMGDEVGLFIGPPGPAATALAAAIVPVLGPVTLVPMRLPEGAEVGIIFCKKPGGP